jgi:hypothetical protein
MNTNKGKVAALERSDKVAGREAGTTLSRRLKRGYADQPIRVNPCNP